jgi:hypothetical protein
MALKYIDNFQSRYVRPSKIYPNWDFWFENKPSGNPGHWDLFMKAAGRRKPFGNDDGRDRGSKWTFVNTRFSVGSVTNWDQKNSW